MSIASLYPSINPSLLLDFANSKVLDPRITFTRTTTATYYDGVTTAKAEQNLLTYSQEFNQSAWAKTLGSITANADTAPDGTATADLFTPSDPASRVQQPFNPIGAVQYVFTVYLRSATGSSFSTDLIAWRDSPFNQIAITTITVTTTWQRFTLTFTALDTTTHSVVIGGGGSLSTGENIYLWGAQLEQRSSATAYTATTTQAITNYIPVLQTAAAGQARFDHNPTTGESLGLLIEEARTNLLTYSSEFDNAAWTKTNATITANTIVAPDGTLTGDKLVETTTANSAHQVYKGTTLTAAPYTFSFYAKAAERTWCVVYFDSGFSAAYINLANGTVGSNPSGYAITVTSVGNGWYRIAATRTATAATWYTAIELATADNVRTYTGDGFSGIFIWGAQLEAGSFATSYIPTVASSVTRNADAASMTGTNFSSWFNNGEGTVYSESTPTAQTSNGHVLFSLLSTAGQNFIASGQYIANSMVRSIIVDVNAVNQVLLVGSNGANNKIAAAYKANDFAGSINGSAASTDTSGTVPVVAQAYLGSLGTFGQPYTGTIKKLAYYPIRVTNTQLQSLTV